MRYRLLLAALLVCMPSMARLQPDAQAVSPEPPSMRFEWVKEGPAEACGGQCREWIAATGPVTADTARDFQLFSEVRDVRGATLVLDSGGGSVIASLELGRKIRALGIKTTVGRTVKVPPAGEAQDQRARLMPRGECASMCVFVLLGGVQRAVPEEARILVHQIWPGSKRYDASAETYTADELVRVQRDVGRIAKYTIEMGGDIELFELAMRIPPWERLRALTQPELRRMRLQTVETASAAPTSGARTLEAPRTAKSHAPERGWTIVEEGARQMLSRRHAITVEGDEVGQFELALGCGSGTGSFKVLYTDLRLAPGTDAARMKDVTLALGGARVALTVGSSLAQADELHSVAKGIVTRSFIEKLRAENSAALVVGTRLTDNTRTSIRLGGAGFAKGLAQLATHCAG